MSDEKDTQKGAVEDGYFENISAMLDSLVPPKEVVVVDVNGNEHRLPGAIAARRQVKVFREFQTIWESASLDSMFSDEAEYNVSAIMAAVMKIAFNEEVMLSLGRAFKEAFPHAVEGDPLDHFAIEEVVSALAPLFIRFVKRAGKTLTGIGNLATAM
mgnify:CR=1 FL=1